MLFSQSHGTWRVQILSEMLRYDSINVDLVIGIFLVLFGDFVWGRTHLGFYLPRYSSEVTLTPQTLNIDYVLSRGGAYLKSTCFVLGLMPCWPGGRVTASQFYEHTENSSSHVNGSGNIYNYVYSDQHPTCQACKHTTSLALSLEAKLSTSFMIIKFNHFNENNSFLSQSTNLCA